MNKPYPKRKNIRIPGYNYSQPGKDFITICVQDREHIFGEIKSNRKENYSYDMVLNEIGNIATKYWLEIPQHFPNVVLHQYIIMPNHIHGILEITGGANNYSPQPKTKTFQRPKGTSKTVGSIVRGFKIGVTKWLRNEYPDDFPPGKKFGNVIIMNA